MLKTLLSGHNRKPDLSIVIVLDVTRREAARSLRSLSASYQQAIDAAAYEVIAVDCNSRSPLGRDFVCQFGPEFHYLRIDEREAGCGDPVRLGLAQASGRAIGVMFNGADILTPGMIRYVLSAFEAFAAPVVCPRLFTLGNTGEDHAIPPDYDQAAEDQVFRRMKWPGNGYRLFNNGWPAAHGRNGWLSRTMCCAALFASRTVIEEIGAMPVVQGGDSSTQTCHALLQQALSGRDRILVSLIGEACFRQLCAPPPDASSRLGTAGPDPVTPRHWPVYSPAAVPVHYLGHAPGWRGSDTLRTKL